MSHIPWPLIVFGVFVVFRVLANASKKAGSSRPPARPQPPRPIQRGTTTEESQDVHWEAPREEIDRFLNMDNRTVVRPGPPPPPVPPGARRTGRQIVVQSTQPHRPGPPPPPRQHRQQPTSPLQQILQIPAQLEAERQRLAHQRKIIENERRQIARQMRELEHRRKSVESAARSRPQRPAKRAATAAAGKPMMAGLPFRNLADLRRAVVLAEVIGPPKAVRYGRKLHRGVV